MENQIEKRWVYRRKSGDAGFNGIVWRLLAWEVYFEQDIAELERLVDLLESTLAAKVMRVLLWIGTAMGLGGFLVAALLAILFGILLYVSIPILWLCMRGSKGVLGFWKTVKETQRNVVPEATKGQLELALLAMLGLLQRDPYFRHRWELVEQGPIWRAMVFGESKRGSQRATTERGRAFVPRLREKLGERYDRTKYKYLRRDLRAWIAVRIKHKGDMEAAWKEIEGWEMEGLRTRAKTLEAIRPFDKAFGLKLKKGSRVAQVDRDGEEEG